MFAKISLGVYVVATIIHYTNGKISLFCLTDVFFIATMGLDLYLSYTTVSISPSKNSSDPNDLQTKPHNTISDIIQM